MKKVWYVAVREFLATVMTKGFVFGVLLTPCIIGLMVFLLPRIMKEGPSKISGQVVVSDPSGMVARNLQDNLAPEKFAERRRRAQARLEWAAGPAIANRARIDASERSASSVRLEDMPRISVVLLEPSADLELEKIPLKDPLKKQGGDPSERLALVIVHPDATNPDAGEAASPGYDLYVRSQLGDTLVDEIHSSVQGAIGYARLQAAGIDPKSVAKLTAVKRAETRTVTEGGERTNSQLFNAILPMAFMILLIVSVLTSGQCLLTTTVEEKSNRVVELLLSAVSSMELMTGKIIGQMAVGFLILVLYAGLGITALASFAMMGLLNPMLLVYLLVFYVMAYFTIAAMMAAVGSAVSELRDAQSLMMPVMLLLMIPWLLMVPITREPNSLLAVVLSLVPPVSNFVIVMRLASNQPPPLWQVSLAIVLGAGGVYVALRFAAKVFRVGLLMFGKPPSLRTLIRWARMS